MSQERNEVPEARNAKRLTFVLGLTLIDLVAEVVGGVLTHSLALLADAGHMLTDVAGLILAIVAVHYARRPTNSSKTYGYQRIEILAAAVNAVILLGVSASILYEAYRRFRNPPEVSSGWMLGVAVIGLVVNLIGIRLLHEDSAGSLNVKGAYLEVISDTLGSIGVIVAALVMGATGWYYADPLISAGIGLFIIPRCWSLLSDAVNVLMEGTPQEIELEAVRSVIEELPGVADVHDLHAWSLTTGVNALSVHVVLNNGSDTGTVLTAVHQQVRSRFPIAHATVQLEPQGWTGDEGETHA